MKPAILGLKLFSSAPAIDCTISSVKSFSAPSAIKKVPLFSMGVAIGRHGGRPENNRDKRKRKSYEEKTGFMYCYGNDADNDRILQDDDRIMFLVYIELRFIVDSDIYAFCEQYAKEAEGRAKEYRQAFLDTGGTQEEWAEHEI